MDRSKLDVNVASYKLQMKSIARTSISTSLVSKPLAPFDSIEFAETKPRVFAAQPFRHLWSDRTTSEHAFR